MKPQLRKKPKQHWMFLLALLMASLLAAPNAFAADTDTDAGATISNIATIVYAINGADQDTVDSNPATFRVDHKVRPVAANAGDANTANGAVDAYLTFTVTNDGNTAGGPLHIRLTAEEDGSDPFNVVANSIRIYEDTNTNGNLDIGSGDTLVTDYSTSSFGTISVDREDTSPGSNAITVFVVANMPTGQAHNDTAAVHLIATAWDSSGTGGTALVGDTDGDDPDPTVVEVVWADDQSTLPSGDTGLGATPTAPDGKHAAFATFTIQATSLNVTKSSSVESDPLGNVAPNAYRVPGARVQYDIFIENTGATDMENVRMVDQIPAGTNYIDGSVLPAVGTSIEYSNDTTTVLPSLPTDWTYVPTFVGGIDANITWIRITLANPVVIGGSVTTSFDVFIQ